MCEKTALVTGASKGIGFETARQLLAKGWRVAILARGNAALDEAVNTLDSDNVMAIICDVANRAEVDAAIKQISNRFGTISALVNNAGVIDPVGLLHKTDAADWMQLQQINIGGVMHVTQAVLPGMIAQKSGVIINLSSGAAHNAVEGWSAYCTSKAAVNMFTHCLHVDYAVHGIRVHDFIPGLVDTDMLNGAQVKFDNAVARLGDELKLTPDIPAKCIAWLADEGEGRVSGVEQSIRDPELRAMVGLEEREKW